MKNKLTREITNAIKYFYPTSFVEVDLVKNGDGEKSVDIFLNRNYAEGLYKESELGPLKAIVEKYCGDKYNYYSLNDEGKNPFKNATIRTIAELLN